MTPAFTVTQHTSLIAFSIRPNVNVLVFCQRSGILCGINNCHSLTYQSRNSSSYTFLVNLLFLHGNLYVGLCLSQHLSMNSLPLLPLHQSYMYVTTAYGYISVNLLSFLCLPPILYFTTGISCGFRITYSPKSLKSANGCNYYYTATSEHSYYCMTIN